MCYKIYKYLIKIIKNYKYTYKNGIFIINFKYVQLMTNLFITYVVIFNKITKKKKVNCVYNIYIQMG